MHDPSYMTMEQAARLCPRKVSPVTMWRWCRKGVRVRGTGERVKMAHIRAGGTLYTTTKDFHEFFKALADADAAHFNRRDTEGPVLSAEGSSTRDDDYCRAHGF